MNRALALALVVSVAACGAASSSPPDGAVPSADAGPGTPFDVAAAPQSDAAEPQTDDAAAPSTDGERLLALLARYEEGALGRADFLAALAAFETSPAAAALRGTLDGVVLLRARPAPYVVDADLQIGPTGVLLVEAGATLALAGQVTLSVAGKLYALGTATAPVTIAGASAQAPYQTIDFVGGRSELVGAVLRFGTHLISVRNTGTTPILVEESRLDDWRRSAIEMAFADGLVIRRNKVGLETVHPPNIVGSETLHGTQSAVRIEGNTFGRRTGYNDVFDLQPCTAPHHPIILGNTFLGGDDDAIDLDDCDAIIVGNHIMNFNPGPIAAKMPVGTSQANGGGITGAGGSALVINNVIENCVHAIGFKDGAKPLILNNTIINNDIGITMYAAGAGAAAAGVALNNVLWNNKADVVLNGSWYSAYNATTMGSLVARHNVLRDPAFIDKDGNLGADPLLAPQEGVPLLGAGSPARGSGEGDLATLAGASIFPAALVKSWLDRDFRGVVRPFAEGRFTGIDRGAVQSGP